MNPKERAEAMAPTRYREPKARSAELLRLALAQMGRHDAAFNPITFAVWYEHVAGVNPPLSAAIDRQLKDGVHIDDGVVAQLHAAHIAPADEAAVGRIGAEMERLMAGLAQSAEQTGSQAGAFGHQLSGLTAALGTKDTDQLAPLLNDVAASTAEMQSSVDTLQQRVALGENEIKKLRQDLDRACTEALRDPLTGILNRKGFDQQLGALLGAAPEDGSGHFLVMLDIDHFKKVNDTHGHIMGDRVIQGVAEILRGAVANPAHSVTRYGGEEFAILLPAASRDECVQLAETVRTRTKAMKIRNRKTQEVLLSVTISGGMAQMQPGDDAAALIARADAALYTSKHEGRDRLTVA
jgi:diguanylate cyclase